MEEVCHQGGTDVNPPDVPVRLADRPVLDLLIDIKMHCVYIDL